jgi:hypothetical protein
MLMIPMALLLAIGLSGRADAQDGDTGECFDAEVSARITAQVPTPPPEFGDGWIVMRWPWFVDLDVRRSYQGGAPKGNLTVLALQHTYWRSNLGFKRWLLRRNDRGTFNLLGRRKGTTERRCAKDAPPAAAYVKVAEGGSLQALREEGERRYGRRRN